MDKDEMKNRISMALKDPILQQGFEIICKENEELKKDYEETEELLDKQIEETYKLFKENVELKAKVEKLKCCQNCKHHYWLYEELSCRIHKIDVDTCNSWEMKND